MRIAYLILAHQYPSQLADLVTMLSHGNRSQFYIHVDRKSEGFLDSPTLETIKNCENVTFLEDRVGVYWGGFSIVEATLQLLRKAVDEGGFQYAVLLSGQDFPIKSNGYIESFFELNLGKEFISYVPLPSDEWGARIMERIEYYWVVDALYRFLDNVGAGKYRKQVWHVYAKLIRSVYKYVPNLKRKFLPGFTPYGGPNWFAISFHCATYVCEYIQEHPEYCRFFAHTLNSDELFLQTLILNSPFRDCVVNDALRFIDWEAGASSPRVLTCEDLNSIVASDSLYARKFDQVKSREVLEKLKSHVTAQ